MTPLDEQRVEAAAKALYEGPDQYGHPSRVSWEDMLTHVGTAPGDTERPLAFRAMARNALAAAYAIDEPRIRAEAERAMVARIVEWLDHGVKSACEANDADEADRLSRLAHAITRKFGGDDHA